MKQPVRKHVIIVAKPMLHRSEANDAIAHDELDLGHAASAEGNGAQSVGREHMCIISDAPS